MGQMPQDMRERVESVIHTAQDTICNAISTLDPTPFREDTWQRPEGGGGRSRVLQNGQVFEKAGVNVSVVHGTLSDEAIAAMGGGRDASPREKRFYATGVSLVLHPVNPMAPTAHANYRYFERGPAAAPVAWWFGGGADLTPAYLFDEDAAHFHRVHKTVCDRFDSGFYPRFKRWCDDYFMIVHRGERRGVGGIFFDDLNDRDPLILLEFCRQAADAFVEAYVPIVQRRKDMPYGPEQQRWQQVRRGRYVEFNLVYDRGTVFGLRSGGRIESILMSLPLTARWEYCHDPEPGSEEARLVEVLQQPREWLGEG